MPRRLHKPSKLRERPTPRGLSRAHLPPNLRHFAPRRKPRDDDQDREPPYPRAA